MSQSSTGAARSSAEVIAEAPSSGSGGGGGVFGVLPLTNFGTVNFNGATVNGQGLCHASPVEITMPSASISSLTCPGTFSVSYAGGGGGRPA